MSHLLALSHLGIGSGAGEARLRALALLFHGLVDTASDLADAHAHACRARASVNARAWRNAQAAEAGAGGHQSTCSLHRYLFSSALRRGFHDDDFANQLTILTGVTNESKDGSIRLESDNRLSKVVWLSTELKSLKRSFSRRACFEDVKVE